MNEPVIAQILFLDFDGVLHSVDEPALDDYFKYNGNPNLFQWIRFLDHALAPYPDVRIIVSSDWRRLFGDDELIQFLGPVGHRFIGVVEQYGPTRAAEIMREAKLRGITHWVAVDDHVTVALASVCDDRFVVCDPKNGLSEETVQLTLAKTLAEKFGRT